MLLGAGSGLSMRLVGLKSPVSSSPPVLPGALGGAPLVGEIPSRGSKFCLAPIRDADFEFPHT